MWRRMIFRWLLEMLQDDQVQMIILRLVERATRHANEDQLALIRGELRALSERFTGELQDFALRVSHVEERLEKVERLLGDIPGPPPPRGNKK